MWWVRTTLWFLIGSTKIIKPPLTPFTQLLCRLDELMDLKTWKMLLIICSWHKCYLLRAYYRPHLTHHTSLHPINEHICHFYRGGNREPQRGSSSFSHIAHSRVALLLIYTQVCLFSLPCFWWLCSSFCTLNARPPLIHQQARRAALFLTKLKVQMDISSQWQKPQLSFQGISERWPTLCYNPDSSANTIRYKSQRGSFLPK